MLNDDEPFEILSPSPAMTALLSTLEKKLAELPDPEAKAPGIAWEDLPFVEFVSAAAKLPLMLMGWAGGEIARDDVAAGEILHELSTDFGIMSGEDLDEQLSLLIEGACSAAEWRRIAEAPTISKFLKNDTLLGWGGFEVENQDKDLRARLERRRMMVDFYRERVDWTGLRAPDLLKGAALLRKAIAADILPDRDTGLWSARIGAELLLRCGSWQGLARAALMGEVWQGLAQNDRAAADALTRASAAVDALLAPGGAWTLLPWPEQTADAEEPEII
ncbi:DUF1266 domain-containing protein [Sutterella sp.]|uniref:DUF1266 domain-containing protein n=1 Tax=Sutterella sp. TaxID=1981025 RepID=UPI0026E0B59A|nr:DUF1266 domain-containing protein [Sutterella sp.]MDO5530885.1 DUF1266 domain-containing protein [Sutterella sp.]